MNVRREVVISYVCVSIPGVEIPETESLKVFVETHPMHIVKTASVTIPAMSIFFASTVLTSCNTEDVGDDQRRALELDTMTR